MKNTIKEIEEIIERYNSCYPRLTKEADELNKKLEEAKANKDEHNIKETYKMIKQNNEKLLYNTASLLAYQHALDLIKKEVK